jgi:hypothetical protein
MKILRWASIPVLLIASLFTCCAARYELLLDFGVCVGAIALIRQAVRFQQYYWAAAIVAVVVVFNPLALLVKLFLLLALACVAVFAKLLTAFQMRPLPLVEAG